MDISRRSFLKLAGTAAATAAVGTTRAEAATAGAYGVLVDTRKCVGCKACQVTCKVWNDNETDPTRFKREHWYHTWSFVQDHEQGVYNTANPLGSSSLYVPIKRQCMHCADPACVSFCPVAGKAIHKENDGPVLIDQTACIRCLTCVSTCPYGVPQFDPGANKVRKCIFCFDRLRAGMKPACVSTCVAEALTYGDWLTISALAEQASADGFPTWGTAPGTLRSWIYIFPKGVDPAELMVKL